MKTITVKQFCVSYNIPQHFIDSLSSFELIEIIEIENAKHLHIDEVQKVEKMMRLHYDLNVNLEGLDIINHLTNQINNLQEEVNQLKNKLDFYK